MSECRLDKRVQLTNHVMSVLDDWGISGLQKIALIGLPEMRARKLDRYRNDEAFPDNDVINQHIEHLIGIADALRTSYPRNTNMYSIWLHKPHRRFANEKPIEIMISKGLSGIIQVRSVLDCSFAWDYSGS